jgi:hypothetical protein
MAVSWRQATRGRYPVQPAQKSVHRFFPGRILISLLGVVLLLMIWAGSALHSGRLQDLKRLRRDRGARVFAHDLHSLIGRWCGPWLLLFGITGALSGLGALGTLGLAAQAFPGAPQQAFMQLLGAPPQVDRTTASGAGGRSGSVAAPGRRRPSGVLCSKRRLAPLGRAGCLGGSERYPTRPAQYGRL